MKKIFILSIATAAILSAGQNTTIDTGVSGSTKQSSASSETGEKTTSKSGGTSISVSQGGTKSKSKTTTKSKSHDTVNQTSETATSTQNTAASISVKTPLTAIYKPETFYARRYAENANMLFNDIDEKLAKFNDGIIEKSDIEAVFDTLLPAKSCNGSRGYGKDLNGDDVGGVNATYKIWNGRVMSDKGLDCGPGLVSHTQDYPSENQIPNVFTKLIGVLATHDSSASPQVQYCGQQFGIGSGTLKTCHPQPSSDNPNMDATDLTFKYSGDLIGQSVLKNGTLTLSAQNKAGDSFEASSSPRHYRIIKKGRLFEEYEPDKMTYTDYQTVNTLAHDNYTQVWAIANTTRQRDHEGDGSEYCEAIYTAQKLSKTNDMSQSELAMRFNDLYPKYSGAYRGCEQLPKLGDVMYDKNANIVVGRTVEFVTMTDESYSKAFAKLLSDSRTASFAEAVQNAQNDLRSWNKTVDATALESLAVKATKSKSFDKISEAVINASTSKEVMSILK